MDDVTIREVLDDLPDSRVIQRPARGWKIILRSEVEAAGADGEEVRRWVERQGGYEGFTLAPTSVRPRRAAASVPAYFAVPPEALEDDPPPAA